MYEKRYDSEIKAIKLRILNGEYEEVLEPLLTRFYSRREHIEDLHDIYVDACLLSALKEWKNGNNEKALEYALMMNDYPANHGYAHLEYYARDAQVYYNIGLGYEKVGDNAKAREYFGKAAGVEVKPVDGIYNYEKALAMKKLDPKANVRNMLRETAKYGKSCVTDYVAGHRLQRPGQEHEGQEMLPEGSRRAQRKCLGKLLSGKHQIEKINEKNRNIVITRRNASGAVQQCCCTRRAMVQREGCRVVRFTEMAGRLQLCAVIRHQPVRNLAT